MSQIEDVAIKYTDEWEKTYMSLATDEYNGLRDAFERALKEIAKVQRHAIAEELSAKSIRSDMASNILLEPHAHNIAINTRVV